MPTTWRAHRTAAVAVLAATVAVASAAVAGSPSLPTLGGAAAGVALAVAALRAGDEPLLAGQAIPVALSLSLLSVCGAGLDQAGAQSWRSILALVAYPFLAHALLRLVAAHREVREADVLVEAALVGTAVGIVLHMVALGWRTPAQTSAWGDAEGAFPAMLVALDVALVVIGVQGLRGRSARRGPLGAIELGLLLLLGAHLTQELQQSHGRPAGLLAGVLTLVGLMAMGAAAVHPQARREPDRLLEQPELFSAAHAGVVIAALLAAPTVLAVQALRGVTASATVATGTMASGVVLACYLIGLLRERAATEHEATHDALTRLPNRTLLVDRLDRSIAHARRNETSCAVLFVDLDRFKEVNDTYGHAEGDRLLQTVASRLQSCVRDEDTVARLSGDEFVVLLPHLSTPDQVLSVAQRVLDSLGEPMTIAEERVLMAGSVGIAVYPNDGSTAQEVLASADAAMYRAKETPGSTCEVFSSRLATQAQARLHLEAALLEALARGELVLHYQPILDVPTGRVVGAEALVRWNHPEQGILLPGHFVPVAEQSDLIVLLGEQVIFDACRELRRWEDLGIDDCFISVNVSARQLSHGLVETVTAALRISGARPEHLVVELTESAAVDNLASVAAILEELRVLGVRAAIDDFGTGYCGLRYLGELPVSSLKIDRSFVQGMTPSSAAIVAATIAMGHALGMSLVAEGVETVEQQRFLEDQGCDRIQGYLTGRPMPAGHLVGRLLAERSSVASTRPGTIVPVPAIVPAEAVEPIPA